MKKIKYPLFVIVNSKNEAIDTANTMSEAQEKKNDNYIKMFADHKGDKSQIGY